MKQVIRLTEGDLRRMIKNCVNEALNNGSSLNGGYSQSVNETSYKTAKWAGDERMKRYRQTHNKEDFDKAYNDYSAATERFRDEYVSPYQYDTMGDKLKGKHSATFDIMRFGGGPSSHQRITVYNKGGDKLLHLGRDTYYSSNGHVTPRQFFRDRDVADKFKKAADELCDYDEGKYTYAKGKGWQKI